ncbi:competence type IV pilus minor pilin ComGF [Bacillus sp. Bva_UNVM-123]|uniref:competence type IV pilus minor pilin ComGF n=1 Tax=Bacillus sp. Bva_UNVM-123 TaxID=2829798 RepID=UPI00391EE88F
MKMYLKGQLKNVSFFNNSGFTMLEMLYAFSIFLIIIAFFPISFTLLFHNERFDAAAQNMEWNVFINQLKKEIRLADEVHVSNGRLLLKKNGQDVLYEKYRTSIRRRVDYSGHEVVLQKIDTVQFEKIKDGVRITVKNNFSETFTAPVYSYLELDKSHDP